MKKYYPSTGYRVYFVFALLRVRFTCFESYVQYVHSELSEDSEDSTRTTVNIQNETLTASLPCSVFIHLCLTLPDSKIKKKLLALVPHQRLPHKPYNPVGRTFEYQNRTANNNRNALVRQGNYPKFPKYYSINYVIQFTSEVNVPLTSPGRFA